MGESERYIDYKHLNKNKRFSLGSEHNAVMTLLALNIIFFLLLLTIKVVYGFYTQSDSGYKENTLQWFQLTADLSVLLQKPWTLITFMFTDTSQNLAGVISNMLWLFVFGSILQANFQNDKIIPIYLYGGFVGAVFFILSFYIAPSLFSTQSSSGLLGANSSTIALATSAVFLFPKHRVFTHIRNGWSIWILFSIFIFFDMAAAATRESYFPFAHLGGFVAGFLFAILLKKGWNAAAWMNTFYHKLNTLFSPPSSKKNQNIKETFFYNTNNRAPINKIEALNEEKLNRILDKINAVGFDQLNEEEKIFLQKIASDENSDNK